MRRWADCLIWQESYIKEKGPFLPRWICFFLHILFGCDVPPCVVCKGDLKLADNGSGIVIHSKTIFGENCGVYQNVTIGERKSPPNYGGGITSVPTIGDNVRIYAGAVVIGDIQIRDNVVIDANAVVTKMFRKTVWLSVCRQQIEGEETNEYATINIFRD